jgi:hypothetical protein
MAGSSRRTYRSRGGDPRPLLLDAWAVEEALPGRGKEAVEGASSRGVVGEERVILLLTRTRRAGQQGSNSLSSSLASEARSRSASLSSDWISDEGIQPFHVGGQGRAAAAAQGRAGSSWTPADRGH